MDTEAVPFDRVADILLKPLIMNVTLPLGLAPVTVAANVIVWSKPTGDAGLTVRVVVVAVSANAGTARPNINSTNNNPRHSFAKAERIPATYAVCIRPHFHILKLATTSTPGARRKNPFKRAWWLNNLRQRFTTVVDLLLYRRFTTLQNSEDNFAKQFPRFIACLFEEARRFPDFVIYLLSVKLLLSFLDITAFLFFSSLRSMPETPLFVNGILARRE